MTVDGKRDEPDNLAVRVGAAIRQVRRRADVSQVELAARTGLDQPRISKIERGGSTASIEDVGRIEHALEVRRGTVLRSAGLVDDALTTAQAIEHDHQLTPFAKSMLAAAYREAVRLSAEIREPDGEGGDVDEMIDVKVPAEKRRARRS